MENTYQNVGSLLNQHLVSNIKQAKADESRSWWHGWINGWDGNMGWHVSGSTFVSGLHSTHSNHREDRRWKILCSSFHHVNIAKSGWPHWQTNWDATWSIGCGHRPLVGLSSYHDNHKEDRRWRVQCGTVTNRL